MRFPGSSDGKESACNAEDLGSILGWERSPGEGKATHSSIFAWRIPWTKEPDGLQSMGSQRVGHDRSDLAHTCMCVHTHTHGCVCMHMKKPSVLQQNPF